MNTQMKTDRWISSLVIVLGFALSVSVAGTLTLWLLGKSLPDLLLALGTVAAAGWLKLLISPLNRELIG